MAVGRPLASELGSLREELAAVRADVAALRDQVPPVLRAIVTEEAANRRRLEHLRTRPEYLEPFEHPDPLVTVCIPTHDRVDMLTGRALPSVLAQTHRRLEVIVVGDASPPHVEAAVDALGDERITFVNLTHRFAPTDAERYWLVGSVRGRNAAYALATGHWIVDFDDDDAMRPHAVAQVLAKAREDRLEVVYGKLARVETDGTTEIVGRFPPTVHEFGWQGAVVHRDLRFLGRELVSAAFGQPNDWFRVETMMRIGVRLGMVDEILYDYYPARLWEHEVDVPDNAWIEEHAW
ncbi:MAG TPA: glycosyltransferase family 2 protein [Gaiellaceae bacterium]|nr:glycosyltransferase family 2 protein [Gaiellaceae bacterium]